ncbi:MAG: Fic family protein [Thermoleophilia bacterium]|nr:Fic family protein [Thermoleophilia bacterium]
MDPSEFHAPEAGRVVTGPDGYAAFVPAPLPPRLRFSRELTLALSKADAALGELCGVGRQLPDPKLLDAPFKRQEALCSSRIEGSMVSLSDLLLDQVGAVSPSVPRDYLREVRRCVSTLRYGVQRLEEVPLSLDLVRELHESLLRGEVGGARTPGEFRTTQNWIGPPGATQATATYVPPPVDEMLGALVAWEAFIRERGVLPDLIQCAMLHEQFQAIHPFVGGNGRLGRLLITLFLIERERLSRPLLYLSAYLEGHRDEYYMRLQRVRTHAEWVPWLLFFLEGVRETAVRGTHQARALARYHAECRTHLKGRALALADELVRTPCMTVPEARRVLGASGATARGAIEELESWSLLEEWGEARRPRVYLARPILDTILQPLEALRSDVDTRGAGAIVKSAAGRREAPTRRADRLMAEAMALIDAAREGGVQLRLIGGLAIRRHCADLDFMDREYSDIDLVGLGPQADALDEVMTSRGFVQNSYVARSTEYRQLQYVTEEALRGGMTMVGEAEGEPTHDAPLFDHVDIFLDVMMMDHDLDVRERLDLDDYAISPADALLAKLQIGKINQKDVHDAIALLKDVPLAEEGEDDEAAIDVDYVADVCARDWGLHRDFTANLRVVAARVDDYGLPADEVERVRGRLAVLEETIRREAKSLRWRVRAAVGPRVAWRREIEDTEGTEIIAPEWDWRRDLG